MTRPLALSPHEFADARGVAVITGGSGGIGAAVARVLVAGGSNVVVTFRSRYPNALLEELGDKAEALKLDVSSPEDCATVIDAVLAKHGAIHSLIHAAGPHVELKYLSQVTPAEFAAQVNADLNGFFNIAHAALPFLRESAGSITAVTSAATVRYPARDGLSAAPKGGIEALARGLAVEEGRYGIRVNCVGPGMLSEGMAERLISSGAMHEAALAATVSNIPLGKFGVADDIAQAVAFLASHRANFITGQKLDVDGGYSA